MAQTTDDPSYHPDSKTTQAQGEGMEQGSNTADQGETAELPKVQFVIPREESGEWSIDGRMTTKDGWSMQGVEINNQRIHPPQQSASLDDAETEELRAMLAQLSQMPLCEPLARLDGERTFRLTINEIVFEEPAMWFRPNGEALLATDDPCLLPVRIAAKLHGIWMAKRSG
jgi:hypothetical protein